MATQAKYSVETSFVMIVFFYTVDFYSVEGRCQPFVAFLHCTFANAVVLHCSCPNMLGGCGRGCDIKCRCVHGINKINKHK